MRLQAVVTNSCILLIQVISALRYDPEEVGFNLNENETARDPMDYWGEWKDHSYYPSPDNWRIPFYTLFIDRFVNGDPANDDANGTQFEHDLLSNQLRHGGDVKGLMDSFDYIQGMGVKALYIAGMPHINMPWGSDGFSPLDLTLLDRHFGNIDDWREMISEAHRRGIYIILENTMSTMGDLIGFKGFLNTSAPFNPYEYDHVWKSSRRYHDFQPGDSWLEECAHPRFWDDLGRGVTSQITLVRGCRDSEFDQYGEVASFGDYREWQRQVSKFAFVQDRLREWRTDVRQKLEHFSCLTIAMLDIDGFRIDKAIQVTLDAQAEWSDSIRRCARRFGKENFYIPGEIVSGNSFGSLYIGRGRQTNQTITNMTEAVTLTNDSDHRMHIRPPQKAALDASAFHYSVYRSLTRFLGMDGTFEAEGDPPSNFVELWNGLVQTNDMVNVNTGKFDPRHLYGTSNQDVFRWPAIKNGTEKQVLALYVVSLLMPGIPNIAWGEEQAFYVLENTNANYVFGRSPMSSSLAWQLHGCYKVGSVKYHDFPIGSASYGCLDDNVSLDHRDPTHPVRGLIKTMFEMRQNYPVLNDGYYLQQLSNKTYDLYLPGSNGTPTETGMWSVLRDRFWGVQDFTSIGQGNQSVWLVYQNDNRTIDYRFNCFSEDALISPFDAGTTVKNLLPPFEEYTLERSSKKLRLEGSESWNGCLSMLTLSPWSFKAFVPKKVFVEPSPFITKFTPGHDWRILSTINAGESIYIGFQFSSEMDCNSITNAISIKSTAYGNYTAQLDKSTVSCNTIAETQMVSWPGALASVYNYSVQLTNVFHGVHEIIVSNASNRNGNRMTNSVDHFIFRIGSMDNPIVWPREANYSTSLLYEDISRNGTLWVSHKAHGADKWRYTLDFGSSYSEWMPYQGGDQSIPPKNWTGTKKQKWDGEHIMVQYWNRITGSSDHWQHGDVGIYGLPPRRYPHFWIEGSFNQFGYDSGYDNEMAMNNLTGNWEYDFLAEWPAQLSLSAWGVNPDGQPDETQVFGDLDGDGVLDRIPPLSLLTNRINLTDPPPSPYLSWKVSLDDGNLRYFKIPIGSWRVQLTLYLLLALVPVATAMISVWAYLKLFYQIKLNRFGISEKQHIVPFSIRNCLTQLRGTWNRLNAEGGFSNAISRILKYPQDKRSNRQAPNADAGDNRRTVLIATMEYDIEDWDIKIKIGGLGVMAQLMGKNLGHQNLIWVVPCIGGINYPEDERADPIEVKILGKTYLIQVQYHVLRNITYVLLDAPVFRSQSKYEPYPPRMDDLNSAIYYSAWNSCIAEVLKRFTVDIYHINDYHGAVAPLHLLPETIPCCLSLHNAEFQGLWPMRTKNERDEVCRVFNLDPVIVKTYVQFGDVFNLLHAAASYLYIHQDGFGAVAVSRKYGKRSYARYPIFWGLKEIGSLPNPDPSDTADLDASEDYSNAQVDHNFEARRIALKQQAQEWAGLHQDASAELFVFLGRWSMQKGIDIIADVFPSVLDGYPRAQLICIGPVIDVYGKFAAIKLRRLMELYPGRVSSRPEFTALPPFIFSGAEFALIPSRDEPFGLVAVEFGRKGALGIGSRVGGLGQMPGWWYTIESMTTKHLIHQFKHAIHEALASKTATRAGMRAQAGRQRFPVMRWLQELDTLQSTAIKKHKRYRSGKTCAWWTPALCLSMFKPTPPAPLGCGESSGGAGHIEGASHSSGSRGGRDETENRSRNRYELQIEGSSSSETDARSSDDTVIRTRHGQQSRLTLDIESDSPQHWRDRAIQIYLDFGDFDLDDFEVPSAFLRDPAINSPPDSCLNTPSTTETSTTLLGCPTPLQWQDSTASLLSVESVVKENRDYNLQKIRPLFTDSNNEYARRFERKLENLNGKNSEDQLCIDEFLSKCEKHWFGRYRDAKMGSMPASSVERAKIHSDSSQSSSSHSVPLDNDNDIEQFLLPRGYIPPSGLKRLLLRRLGDWPLYSLLLAFGQIIAANSYQVTLLNGEVGEPAEKLYIVATIYLVSSIIWWIIFRLFKPVVVLSVPFIFYGSAFLFIGCSPFVRIGVGRAWMQNAATGLYAFASSSGSIFFALNFGDEGNAPVTSWAFRACVIQGIQQLYVTFLWFWGSSLTTASETGLKKTSLADSNPHTLIGVGVGIAIFLWAIGGLIFLGLPSYYRQTPGKVPSFYRTLLRRKIVLWFFYTVFIQNYFLSAPYGRNWLYLWSSQHAKKWHIVLLVLLFFVVVWAIFLWCFSVLSKRHAWIIPIFAVGLGTPRWCQMLWSTSNIGAYLPWAGGPLASALVGRVLWLWLGVLDTVQGVGFGMILINTLTRFHIVFTLLAAQVIGSISTILARASAPDKVGPGDVFPSFAAGVSDGLSRVSFWICLIFLLSTNVLCFMFFRKGQLQKP
ncbi:putative alpha-1,3-glucan synthase [Paecilomyces variotii]|uniref:alpha-1,3-glucan synthase n=1 Tax=Byssochlamys spectabilis TaxID=264951 RepID=A0A443I8G5_BYSSP|nr:putative alpha-1,3-glucan synthase [Paecilomyces variotii]KAJ9408695.1 CAZyme family GH13 [Paecilomyces variotii]RWR00365.1 putative alpha-1,3-glucan synthase [Paecilomyces variotii]